MWAAPKLAATITDTGGFNSDEALAHLDRSLIAHDPTVLYGFFDNAALCQGELCDERVARNWPGVL